MQFIFIIWSPRLVPNEEQRLMSICQEGGKDIFFASHQFLPFEYSHICFRKNNIFVPKLSPPFHVILESHPDRVNWPNNWDQEVINYLTMITMCVIDRCQYIHKSHLPNLCTLSNHVIWFIRHTTSTSIEMSETAGKKFFQPNTKGCWKNARLKKAVKKCRWLLDPSCEYTLLSMALGCIQHLNRHQLLIFCTNLLPIVTPSRDLEGFWTGNSRGHLSL